MSFSSTSGVKSPGKELSTNLIFSERSIFSSETVSTGGVKPLCKIFFKLIRTLFSSSEKTIFPELPFFAINNCSTALFRFEVF